MAGDFVCKLFRTQLKSVRKTIDDIQKIEDQVQELIDEQKKNPDRIAENVKETQKQINNILVYLKTLYESQNQDPSTNTLITMFTNALITRFEKARDQVGNEELSDYPLEVLEYDVELMMDQIERLKSSAASSEELKNNLEKALGNRDC